MAYSIRSPPGFWFKDGALCAIPTSGWKMFGGGAAGVHRDADDEGGALMDEAIPRPVEQRLGRVHLRQRLGIEGEHEARVLARRRRLFRVRRVQMIRAL